jgi:hypothetical protein
MSLSVSVSDAPQLALCSASDLAQAINSHLGPGFADFSSALVANGVDGKRLSVLLDLQGDEFDAVIAVLRAMHASSGLSPASTPATPSQLADLSASASAACEADANIPLLRGVGLEYVCMLGKGGFGTGGSPSCFTDTRHCGVFPPTP